MSFRDMEIPVTMTGEEWFALLAFIAKRDLSAKGRDAYNRALGKMSSQVVKVARDNPTVTATIIRMPERPSA